MKLGQSAFRRGESRYQQISSSSELFTFSIVTRRAHFPFHVHQITYVHSNINRCGCFVYKFVAQHFHHVLFRPTSRSLSIFYETTGDCQWWHLRYYRKLIGFPSFSLADFRSKSMLSNSSKEWLPWISIVQTWRGTFRDFMHLNQAPLKRRTKVIVSTKNLIDFVFTIFCLLFVWF